jgi:restriction system protein
MHRANAAATSGSAMRIVSAGVALIEYGYLLSVDGKDDMSLKKSLNAAATDALLKLDGMSIQEVERLATGAYRVRGYEVRVLDSADSQDNDLLLTRETQRVLLQCKYWKTRKIGEMPVRELYGVMAAHSATGGVLISSGTFSLEASRFAGLGGIELLDAGKFRQLLSRESAQPAHSLVG